MSGGPDHDGARPTPVETDVDSDVEDARLAASEPPREYRPGDRIGRYVVMATVGRGGMGIVYAAWDPKLDRRVALKLVGFDASAEVQRGRLLREGQALARLEHPNVVAVHDVGIHTGQVYIAMEFVEGQSLRRWLEAKRRPLARILEVFIAAGRGLAAAHEGGLVHRDVKPDNVLIAHDGQVKVVDFGLARDDDDAGPQARARAWAESEPAVARALERASSEHVRAQDAPRRGPRTDSSVHEPDSGPISVISTQLSTDERLTAVGRVLGTPAYMAPEQHARARVDQRSDQYGFCVSLWEAVYGKRPFSGTTTTKLARRKRELRIRESSRGLRVPKWLRAALLRGLNPWPRRRYETLDGLLAELEAGLERRRRWRWPAAAFVGLALVSAVVWGLQLEPEGPAPCEPPSERLYGVWDPQRRAELEAAFAASEVAYAEDSAARVRAVLDRYAERWLAAEVEVCESARRGEHDEAWLEDRLLCLDDRLRKLAGLSAELVSGEAEVIERATRAVASLPPISACADDHRATQVPLPSEGALRESVARELERLAGARVELELGRFEAGVEQARAVANAARVLGWAPLEAEALYLIGTAGAALADDLEAQSRDLHATARAALEAELPGLLVQTWAALSRVRLDAGDEADARRWLSYAERLAARGGLDADPLLAVALIHTREDLAFKTGDFAAAEDHVRRRLGLLRAYYGPDSAQAASALNSLGNVVYMQYRKDAAAASFRESLRILEAVHGPDHPSVAHMHNNIGVVSTDREAWDEAERHYLRALEIREASYPPAHHLVIMSLTNLANLYLFSTNYAAGVEPARTVVERREAVLERDYAAAEARGHSPTTLARVRMGLVPDLLRYAQLLAGVGRHRQAIAALERGLALLDELPVGPPGRLPPAAATPAAGEGQPTGLDGCRADLLNELARSRRARGQAEAAAGAAAARAALAVGDSEDLQRCLVELTGWQRETE